MPQEITRQADYYGLDAPERSPAPPAEKLADQLAPPTPWSGPTKLSYEVDGPLPEKKNYSDEYAARELARSTEDQVRNREDRKEQGR